MADQIVLGAASAAILRAGNMLTVTRAISVTGGDLSLSAADATVAGHTSGGQLAIGGNLTATGALTSAPAPAASRWTRR